MKLKCIKNMFVPESHPGDWYVGGEIVEFEDEVEAHGLTVGKVYEGQIVQDTNNREELVWRFFLCNDNGKWAKWPIEFFVPIGNE